MLKSFREGVLTAPRWPDLYALRALWRAVAYFLALASLAWLLSRATLVTLTPACALSPFAVALFAAAIVEGIPPAGLVTGCALGAIRREIASYNLALPIGCAVVLGGSLAWHVWGPRLTRWLPGNRRAPKLQARSPNENQEAVMLLAGMGVLVPGLIYANGAPWPSIQATLASVAALAAAPYLRAALGAARDRARTQDAGESRGRCRRVQVLTGDARTGALLLGLMAEGGVWAVYPPAALGVAALALTLFASVGAQMGLALGLCALLFTDDPRMAAVLGACGAAVHLSQRSRDAVRAGCVAGAGLIAALSLRLPATDIIGLCAGPPFVLLLSGKLKTGALRWFDAAEAGCAPERLSSLLRGDVAERLRAMSDAFGDLAEGYLAPLSMPDEQALLGQLRDALCEGCSEYAACWAGEDNRGARLLCDLVAEAMDDGATEPLFEAGVPAELARRCRRGHVMSDRVGGLLSEFVTTRRRSLKRAGENRLIFAQFLQAQALVDALAREQEAPLRLRDGRARQAAAALRQADLDVAEVLRIPGRQDAMLVTLREGRWTEPAIRRAARQLGDALCGTYMPQDARGRTVRFDRLPKYAAEVGAGCVSGLDGAPNGDSHLTAMLDDARLLVLICDGMGSGEAAQRESALAVRLLGRFLKAGADWTLAVETVNAMLLNASTEDMFSTVDMLILDLSTGVAECMKLAACPTLIVREGRVERVEGGRLPLGILESVQPAACRVRLMPGDTLLMASDGVMDAADPEQVEALLADPGEDMNALSERVLDLAQATDAHRDDMTAVCMRIVTA